jgi:hypothetical protein
MVRTLTKPEVIRRIAMRALLDAVPGMTHARLVTLCHASYTTVHDAANMTIQGWLHILDSAPDPRPSRTMHRQPDSLSAIDAISQAQQSTRPGDRRRARLVEPEANDQAIPPDDDSGADIEPSDVGWEDDRNRVIVDPQDNPTPRKHKKSHEKGAS